MCSVVVALFSVLFRVCPMPCQLDVSESKTPSSFIEYSTKVKTTSLRQRNGIWLGYFLDQILAGQGSCNPCFVQDFVKRSFQRSVEVPVGPLHWKCQTTCQMKRLESDTRLSVCKYTRQHFVKKIHKKQLVMLKQTNKKRQSNQCYS